MSTKWSAFASGSAISGTDTTVGLQSGANVKWTFNQAATFFWASPTLVTPTLGVATATSINKVAFTAPASSATLTIADGKTLTANATLTFAGTDGTTMTFPAASDTVGALGTAQTWTNANTHNVALTVASGASATLDNIKLTASTTTLSGSTNITTAKGFNAISLYQPTYSAASALTITNAATLYIEQPVGAGAGPATITNPYSLWTNGSVRIQLASGQTLPAMEFRSSAGALLSRFTSTGDNFQTSNALTIVESTFSNAYARLRLVGSNQGAFELNSTGYLGWNNATIGNTLDVFLTRNTTAVLQMGAADAAAPVAQTFVAQSVVAGTTNTAGANWTFVGSKSTGTGAGGQIIFQTTPAGSTGSTVNTVATGLTITAPAVNMQPSAVVGNQALATTATDGFLYIAGGSGAPSATPTSFTGRYPLYWDHTNKQLYIYDGAWLQPKTPAAAAIVNWQ